jgi:hypothetical protein
MFCPLADMLAASGCPVVNATVIRVASLSHRHLQISFTKVP